MEYKWRALSVTSVGALMAAVDGTIVLLALLPIAQDLRSDFLLMIWVVVAYLLVNTAFVLSLGRVGDMLGRKRMYNTGFAVFTAGSVLCGLAPDALLLVAFRAVQGLGAALLTANSFAILSEAFPRQERGRAFGITAIVWGFGSVLGIILGGVLITFTSWRVIFLINLPIGAFGTLWAWRALRETSTRGQGESFDLPGAALFTLALLLALLGVTWGLLHGWGDAATLALLACAPVAFAGFAAWETWGAEQPIVDFALFRERAFSFGVATGAVQSLAVFSVNFLLVFYLEGIAGLDILTASYLIVPMAAATALVGPLGGMLADRVGARRIVAAGLLVQGAGLVLLSQLSTSTPLLQVGAVEALLGLGAGLFWPANTSAIMGSAPAHRYGVASGVMNTFRNTGMVLSFALAMVAATSVIPQQVVYALFIGTLPGKLPPQLAASYLAGQRVAFEIAAGLLLVAIALALARPAPEAEPGAARSADARARI